MGLTDDVAIRVEQLRHTYPGASRPAVDGMTFQVRAGEVLGFLGPSGVGKTTTQQAIIGLLHGWTGSIDLLGRPRDQWGDAVHDRIGVSFELPVGHPRLTGYEELAHHACLHDRRGPHPRDLLDRLGLAEAGDQPLAAWSKGMRVRLNLARALVHDPDVLFLDEPTSGLDPVSVEVVRGVVRDERDRGRTIFLTTHDMPTAAAVCDRVAFVVGGRIVASGSPRALGLAHGRRVVRIEFRGPAGPDSLVVPLDDAADRLPALLAAGTVETIHTQEAGLEEVFAVVTATDRGSHRGGVGAAGVGT